MSDEELLGLGQLLSNHGMSVEQLEIRTISGGPPVLPGTPLDPEGGAPFFVWDIPQGNSRTIEDTFLPVGNLHDRFRLRVWKNQNGLLVPVVTTNTIEIGELTDLGNGTVAYQLNSDDWTTLTTSTGGEYVWTIQAGWSAVTDLVTNSWYYWAAPNNFSVAPLPN